MIVSFPLSYDLELFYKHSKKNCIYNGVGNINLNHYEQLSVRASIDFDKHEGNGRVVPYGKILVPEQRLSVILLLMCPCPGLVDMCRSQLCTGDYCSKIYRGNPLFASLHHVPHHTGNHVSINYKKKGIEGYL